MTTNTVTTWPVTPAQAESLRSRKCEACSSTPPVTYLEDGRPLLAEEDNPRATPCSTCHGTGRVRPPQVVAAVENVPDGTETIENYRDGIWRAYRDGHMIDRVDPCPVGPAARRCEWCIEGYQSPIAKSHDWKCTACSGTGLLGGVCEAVEIQVDCRACHRTKAPRGRDLPDVKAAEFCHPTECAGYDIPPLPPATFFNEPIARFRVAAVEVVEGRWVCDECLHLEDYERVVRDVRSRCWECGTGQMIYFLWIWIATVEWEEGG